MSRWARESQNFFQESVKKCHFCLQPWDDETDMDEMLKNVKSIEMDGLLWGASKLIPIGYGIKKLQVSYISFSCLSS